MWKTKCKTLYNYFYTWRLVLQALGGAQGGDIWLWMRSALIWDCLPWPFRQTALGLKLSCKQPWIWLRLWGLSPRQIVFQSDITLILKKFIWTPSLPVRTLIFSGSFLLLVACPPADCSTPVNQVSGPKKLFLHMILWTGHMSFCCLLSSNHNIPSSVILSS
jgi:hypothetical protein